MTRLSRFLAQDSIHVLPPNRIWERVSRSADLMDILAQEKPLEMNGGNIQQNMALACDWNENHYSGRYLGCSKIDCQEYGAERVKKMRIVASVSCVQLLKQALICNFNLYQIKSFQLYIILTRKDAYDDVLLSAPRTNSLSCDANYILTHTGAMAENMYTLLQKLSLP